jgi:hypothetical protein
MEGIMKEAFIRETHRCGVFIIFTASLITLFTLSLVQAQEIDTIKLSAVNTCRGSLLMDALSNKASAKNLMDNDLSLRDLSDLLWAAAGINRPDTKKRTYSTAMNTQDVEVYVFMKDGVYIYDYEKHALNPVLRGDHRADIAASAEVHPSGTAGAPPVAKAKVIFALDLLLVSDPAKYRIGTDDQKKEWGAFSAGMIAQNVMLFCSANNFGTRPRAAFNKAKLRELLKLKDTQNPVIELPVGYLTN